MSGFTLPESASGPPNAGVTYAELARRAAAAEAASDEKTRMMAAVSHDLRQPMLAAQLYVGTLRGTLRRGDLHRADQQAEHVESSLETLATTLDHLLTAARYDSGTEPVGIAAVDLSTIFARVEQTLAPEAARRGLALRVRRPWPAILVSTDATALWRVLMNLVANALKFTQARAGGVGGVLLRASLRARCCRIDVVDNGIGMSADVLASIWQPYFQAGNRARERAQGLGLGLFLVKRAIGRLPGHAIDARSSPGRGSRFSVTVPVIEA